MPQSEALNELIVLIFRANGALLTVGNRLAAPSQLTSARWQILGVLDHGAATHADVARTMGMTRQSVRETARGLVGEGCISEVENPRHRRAKLLQITEEGERRLREVEKRQAQWLRRVARHITPAASNSLLADLRSFCEALAAAEPAKGV